MKERKVSLYKAHPEWSSYLKADIQEYVQDCVNLLEKN